ncbi:uncharacterized protein BDZ99DRAFT_382694 [Mytilinidion resinicola]|uniref:GID complex catalytic subunit 2 n=1 Tax=Mytilinidion resinicola TaxID=574789 RepID=A0A6A6YWG9_9PEZI|nr:uncharacterized protein BDZ99DRAFT_382694 [Mytilinidion resinicola]KAF2813120.1 hypothetical protein BDZ99DRAFT_382694 [Mytilinidion resinicola]
MEALQREVEQLQKENNLEKTVEDVQKTIDLLLHARQAIAADASAAPVTMAKLQNSVQQSFDRVNRDLKPVHQGLNNYQKAVTNMFKDKPLPTAENDALSSHPSLVNRAIAMHLLREGQFSVAATFIEEANAHPPQPEPTPGTPNPYLQEAWEKDLANGTFNSQKLQQQFAEMYHILHELKQQKNLAPAIAWAKERSIVLENRGSNLEFELCRLQFVCLFKGGDIQGPPADPVLGVLRAMQYARSDFGPFQHRYGKEVSELAAAMPFAHNMAESPYRRIFYNDSAWEEVATSFTREFCSLLGLSADSPLYIAATAGAIALPTLLKLQKIMKDKRTEWTTQNELPVEIPLPPAYHFHSIFVCPVSKEQATDQNPPMMMPCGHVIAKESLDKISKGARFKCPYCPAESHPREAKKVFL